MPVEMQGRTAISRSVALVVLLVLGARGSAGGQLHEVAVAREGTGASVQIDCNGSFEYDSYTLQSPERFVVDLFGVTKAFATAVIPGNVYPVGQIRLAQRRSDAVRLIVDLDAPATASLERLQEGILLKFEAGRPLSPAVEIKVERRPPLSPQIEPRVESLEENTAIERYTGTPEPILAEIQSTPETTHASTVDVQNAGPPELELPISQVEPKPEAPDVEPVEAEPVEPPEAEAGSQLVDKSRSKPIELEPEKETPGPPPLQSAPAVEKPIDPEPELPEIDRGSEAMPPSQPSEAFPTADPTPPGGDVQRTEATTEPAGLAPEPIPEPVPVSEPSPPRAEPKPPAVSPRPPASPPANPQKSASEPPGRSTRGLSRERTDHLAGESLQEYSRRRRGIEAPTVRTDGRYSVLVLESSDRAEADRWRRKLAQSGERVFLNIVLESGGPSFRVLLGRFEDRGEALQAAERANRAHGFRTVVLEYRRPM